jgi:hypothetical protein
MKTKLAKASCSNNKFAVSLVVNQGKFAQTTNKQTVESLVLDIIIFPDY